MQMPKELREKPFDKYSGGANRHIRYQVKAFFQIHNHERIYVIELIANPKYQRYTWRADSCDKNTRIAISKKNKDYAVFTEGATKSSCPEMSKYLYLYEYVSIPKQSESVLQQLLGTKKDHIAKLCELLSEYHQSKIEEQRRKSGYIDDGVVYECPTECPKDFLKFVKKEIIDTDKTLIYKRGGVRGTCAYCGEKVKVSWGNMKFRQYQNVKCPNCGEDVQCILENSAAWKADYVKNVITMERQGDRIWFRQYHVLRDNEAVYENLESYLDEVARYVIIGNKSAAWRREAKYGVSHKAYKFSNWERYSAADVYDWGYIFYCADIPETVQGTILQYAELEKYTKLKRNDPVKYCRYFIKYPVFEFFMKKGMERVVNEKLFGGEYRDKYNAILWQRKKLKECFKFPIRLLGLLPPEKWSLDKFKACHKLYKRGFKDSEIQKSLILGVPIDATAEIARYMTVSKLCDYIQKQNASNNGVAYRDYADYLADCKNLGFDMKSKSVLFPKNLHSAHQRTIAMIEHKRKKDLDIDILKVYKKHQKKAFEENGLLIRPAKSSLELIKEGQALHHCVGGYAEKMARGETTIFFVRDTQKKTKPYFTLEYKNGAVIQCRTLDNRSYETEEKVKVFVEHWLKKMKKGA